MKLNLEQIKSVTKGVEKVDFENGKFNFYRFSEQEARVINNPNLFYTAGVQMEFKTDGSRLKLKANIRKSTTARTYFAFDIFVGDFLLGSIQNFDEGMTGDYANKKYELGSFEGEFLLGEGEKNVKIVFPHSAIAEIKEIELIDATFVLPVRQEKNIIFYGDSITQGYDALHPSKSYAHLLSNALNADSINKALGGETFFPNLAAVSNDLSPDYVISAYGTNDWSHCGREELKSQATAFLDNIAVNYPDSPIYVISPIWRKDYNADKKFGPFSDVEKLIEMLCDNRPNIHFVSGWELVPHNENYYGDLLIHPNAEGFEHYFKNLASKIIK